MSSNGIINKTSIANIMAGIAIGVGVIYAYITGNNDLMTFIVGAAIGYLFGRSQQPRT